MRFSDEGHAIQAAVAGHGIALVSLALIADELEAGHLVQPFGPTIDGHTFHLTMSAGRAPTAPVQAVAQWLRAQAGPALHCNTVAETTHRTTILEPPGGTGNSVPRARVRHRK